MVTEALELLTETLKLVTKLSELVTEALEVTPIYSVYPFPSIR